MDTLYRARSRGIPADEDAWRLECRLMDFLEGSWCDPDNGIREVRSPRRHFTHSKIMAWAAADRAVKAVRDFGLEGSDEPWLRMRKELFDEACEQGFDAERNTFTQHYGSRSPDASPLTMPTLGFLPATDERVRGTVWAVERELADEGLLHRYTRAKTSTDCPRARTRFYRAASGWPTTTSSAARPNAAARCSNGRWSCATTSACSPRSTTPVRGACPATTPGADAPPAHRHGPPPQWRGRRPRGLERVSDTLQGTWCAVARERLRGMPRCCTVPCENMPIVGDPGHLGLEAARR